MAVRARIQINTYRCQCAYYESDDSYQYCSECKNYDRRKKDAEAVKQLKELQRLADIICRKTNADNEAADDETPVITVEVSGGMVQNVYTTLGIDLEVDIMDFDDAGSWTDQERDDLDEHRDQVVAKQRIIY